MARRAYWDGLLVVWPGVGPLLAPVGIASLRGAVARVSADAYGLRSRTSLRSRSVPWRDVTDLRVHLKYGNNPGSRRPASRPSGPA